MTEAAPLHVVDAPLSPPAPRAGLIEVFRRRYLLRMLVQLRCWGLVGSLFLMWR